MALAPRAPRLPPRPVAALWWHWPPWQQETDRVQPSEDTVLLGQVGVQDFMTRMPPGLAVERGRARRWHEPQARGPHHPPHPAAWPSRAQPAVGAPGASDACEA